MRKTGGPRREPGGQRRRSCGARREPGGARREVSGARREVRRRSFGPRREGDGFYLPSRQDFSNLPDGLRTLSNKSILGIEETGTR